MPTFQIHNFLETRTKKIIFECEVKDSFAEKEVKSHSNSMPRRLADTSFSFAEIARFPDEVISQLIYKLNMAKISEFSSTLESQYLRGMLSQQAYKRLNSYCKKWKSKNL